MSNILTTHVGSLPRSKELSEFLFAKDKGEKFSQSSFDEVLKNNEDVLYLDGDIIIENSKFIQYFIDNIKNNDLLIQDENHKNIKCAGLMYIKSNETTKKYFNPKNITYKTTKGWTDQTYVNQILPFLKYSVIDSNLFPNGKYYYKKYATLNPYLIHFNFIVGHEKKKRMQHFEKWYND